MVTTTKLTLANTSQSLRTIVPIHIIRQMKLERGDHIDWDLDKEGRTWIVKITKNLIGGKRKLGKIV